jgi:hypothetical protein
LTISVGTVIRGTKLIVSISAGIGTGNRPPPSSTLALTRGSTAVKICPANAPRLMP